jgi:peptide/nickel transport system substrate-binding protein
MIAKRIIAALTRIERTVFIAALVIAGASAATLGVFMFRAVTSSIPAQGGTFTEGVVGQPTYVNPILAENPADKALARLLFANLPILAEKMAPDETGRVWSVRLKENLRWSDGRKITSDDLLFTIAAIQDPDTASPLFQSWQGIAGQRLSELETQFVLAGPYPFFERTLRALSPVPKHIFADTPGKNWRLSDYNLTPVGSGPYAFTSYERRADGFIERYSLARNAVYSGAVPFIDTAVFQFFTQEDDLLRAFNAGRVDGFGKLDPTVLQKITRTHTVTPFSLSGYYAVFLNQSEHPALKEPAVRRTLSATVRRNELLQNVLGGYGRESLGPMEVAVVPASTTAPDAPATALETAGWAAGADGIREKSIGGQTVRLAFDLIVPNIPFLAQTANDVAKMWRPLGVAAAVKPLGADDMATALKNRQYQAILFGNFVEPPQDLYPFWHSDERFSPGLNLSLWNNARGDTLMEQIRREPNNEKRAAALEELESLVRREMPAIFLFTPDYLYVTSRSISGIAGDRVADPAGRFARVADWYMHTTRAFR